MKQYEQFKSALAFQKHLQAGKYIPDEVIVGGILFTMDNYDDSGKEISYSNIKHQKQMLIITENRYSVKGTSDAIVEIDELFSKRVGFPYVE